MVPRGPQLLRRNSIIGNDRQSRVTTSLNQTLLISTRQTTPPNPIQYRDDRHKYGLQSPFFARPNTILPNPV